MTIVEAAAPTFEIYEPDIYRARVDSVEFEERQPDAYNKEPYTQFVVSTVLAMEGEGRGKPLKLFLKNSTGRGSKLNEFATAIGLDPYEAGDSIDTDDWLGQWLRINLDDKKRDGMPGNRVLAYLPLKKAAVKADTTGAAGRAERPARPTRLPAHGRAPAPLPPDEGTDEDDEEVPF